MPLLILAIAAIVWSVIRACLQSITMDEASTYMSWVAPAEPNHWFPHSNNHLLNSLLIRWTTTVFGLSPWSVRLPALLGACVYIGACAALCYSLFDRKSVRVVVFLCLIWNPYVCDFYVAARGYGLAFGFLFAAIAIVARWKLRGVAPGTKTWMAMSIFLGLAFTANFAFALVIAAVGVALLAWAGRPFGWRTMGAAILPGAVVVLVLASWTLMNWQSEQLFDGARSVREMFSTVLEGALNGPNPEVANPHVLQAANAMRPFVAPVLLGAVVLQVVLLFRWRKRLFADAAVRRKVQFSMTIAGALAGALLVHWIAFLWFGLLLPRNRTGIYMIPLFTLAVGGLAAAPVRVGRVALTAVLAVLAGYYAVCFRTGWFHEWRSNADSREVYEVVASYSARAQISDVPSRAPLTDIFEFYRRASGNNTLAPFREEIPLARGKAIYAFYEVQEPGLLARERVKVVYRSRYSDLVVAVRPALDVRSPSRFDDTDPQLQYSGGWFTDFQFAEALGGTVTYSADPRASVRLRFRGSSVRYVYTKAPNRGVAEVSIDGVVQRRIDLHAPETEWRSSTTITGLSDKEHVLEIRAASRNGGTGSFIDVDAIEAGMQVPVRD